MDPDGTLHVTPPGGRTRITRPACIAEVDMSTPSSTDLLSDLLGPTPERYRSSTPEQRAARRAAAAERARLSAEIEAELASAASRFAAERGAGEVGDDGVGDDEDAPYLNADLDSSADPDPDPDLDATTADGDLPPF